MASVTIAGRGKRIATDTGGGVHSELTLAPGANVSISISGSTATIAAGAGEGGVSDGDKGDLQVTDGGTVWTLDPAVATSAGRAVLGAADAAGQRAALGLGTAATTAATDYATAGHDHAGTYAPVAHGHGLADLAPTITDGHLLTRAGAGWAGTDPASLGGGGATGGAVAGVSTTSNTTGTTLIDLGTLAAGTYLLRMVGRHTSAATTTAARVSMQGTATVSHCSLSCYTAITAIAAQSQGETTWGAWTAGTTGPGATARVLVIDASFVVTGSGTARVDLRSEVSGSAVTVVHAVWHLTQIG